ncbi:MAG: outer membrane beta-barrel protein [Chitinivibrionales bacterium]|nr:outer membrane beta-barrel protein [Chitinivibrionales bacterium]
MLTKKLTVAGALAACFTLTTPAIALEPGDILVRGGIGHVNPTEESDAIPGFAAGTKVEADSDTTFAFTLVYMLTSNVGLELLGSAPFEHDIDGAGGALAGAGTIGSTKHLPPTLSAQYYFNSSSNVRPYVGVGVNYTRFFDEELTGGGLAGADLDLDASWGLAAQAGVDVDLNDKWFVNGSVWYMNIESDATVAGATNFDVAIDPWVLFAGVGYKF